MTETTAREREQCQDVSLTPTAPPFEPHITIAQPDDLAEFCDGAVRVFRSWCHRKGQARRFLARMASKGKGRVPRALRLLEAAFAAGLRKLLTESSTPPAGRLASFRDVRGWCHLQLYVLQLLDRLKGLRPVVRSGHPVPVSDEELLALAQPLFYPPLPMRFRYWYASLPKLIRVSAPPPFTDEDFSRVAKATWDLARQFALRMGHPLPPKPSGAPGFTQAAIVIRGIALWCDEIEGAGEPGIPRLRMTNSSRPKT